MKLSLQELGLAYRRAKADLYYTHHANSVKILHFERNLVDNLKRIYSLLKDDETEQVLRLCYGWRLVPKIIKMSDKSSDGPIVKIPDDTSVVEQCELRLIEDLPVEFHVITQLWIDRVAALYESAMSKNSYGYRVRMNKAGVNRNYPGTFKNWALQYRKWHDGGLEVIHRSLINDEDLIVMTADLTAFYHNVKPEFILDAQFCQVLGVQLASQDDRYLTKLVVSMLNHWAKNTPLGVGLPVGCSISAVIANLALTLMDRELEQLPGLVYYGRYVDDIILAVQNSEGLSTKSAFVEWLHKWAMVINSKDDAIACRTMLSVKVMNSELEFHPSKTKVFFCKGKASASFFDNLRMQVARKNSEWRALPDLPDDPQALIRSIISITGKDGMEVNKLRQAEDISLRRATFAMKLADFSDYAHCLTAKDWKTQRESFLEAIALYFTSAKSYFELNRYFPRLIAIAMQGIEDDVSQIDLIIKRIFRQIVQVLDNAFQGSVLVASRPVETLEGFGGKKAAKDCICLHVCRGFIEAVASVESKQSARDRVYGYLFSAFQVCRDMVIADIPPYNDFLYSDLALVPYKSVLYSVNDLTRTEVQCARRQISVLNVVPDALYNNAQEIVRYALPNVCENRILGFLFPTRRLSPVELYALLPCPFAPDQQPRRLICQYLKLHGYGVDLATFPTICREQGNVYVDVQDRIDEVRAKGAQCRNKTIALAYWRLMQGDWDCQVTGSGNLNNPKRFGRLMRLVNQILRHGQHVDYVMFPELAMPWRWFMLLSRKLSRSRISLLSGVEYVRGMRLKSVRNEVWCTFSFNGFGYLDWILVRVVKTMPAIEEASDLRKHGLKMETLLPRNTIRAGDIIVHGADKNSVFLSVLICSDLTNIALRAKLRGAVDALLVPAWNKDVKTFNSLVMSTAYDLHSYVALCNNGEYGDVRLRAPYEKEFDRDIVQLKGGNNDYFVIGTLDVQALRRFHNGCPATNDSKFKPLPIGFSPSKRRQMI